MTDNNRTYMAIDLKSYYASAECAARNLDPLTTNLVVADPLPYRKNDLSGRFPIPESLWHSWPGAAFRGSPEGQRGQRFQVKCGNPES